MDKESKGFIKLDRNIFEHWIFQDAEKFKAFVDLIQLARWKDEKLLIGNDLITVPRGSYYTSELKLAERWGWGRDKTRNFLSLIEKEGMISKKGTTKGTMLTVENYRFYQDEHPTQYPTKTQRTNNEPDIKPTSNQHQTNNEPDTKEEIKEREEIKEVKESKEYIAKESKHKYGEYKHVLLTDTEHTKLINELGISLATDAITYLDEYIEMKGYKAKSHYLCIKKWVVDAVKRKVNRNSKNISGTTQNLQNLYKEAQNEENRVNSDINDPF